MRTLAVLSDIFFSSKTLSQVQNIKNHAYIKSENINIHFIFQIPVFHQMLESKLISQ